MGYLLDKHKVRFEGGNTTLSTAGSSSRVLKTTNST